MSQLSEPGVEGMDPQALFALRRRAAERLAGPAAAAAPAAGIADALSVLHALASSPATAPDALALLHELQVNQVELDLQAQELRSTRDELESALRLQSARRDALPVGCLVVDAEGMVLELNETAARLLGLPAGEGPAHPVGQLLGDEDRQRLDAALRRPRAEALDLLLHPGGPAPQRVMASVAPDVEPGHRLLCLVAVAPGR
jgi:PAS domain-containing protein